MHLQKILKSLFITLLEWNLVLITGETEVSINYLDFDQNKITYTLFELYGYGDWRVNCTNSRTISEIIEFKEDES